MGFETAVRAKTPLAPDLPNAGQAAQQHPDGAVYVSESPNLEFRGKRYRLRHARWVLVTVRKRENKDTKPNKR